MMQPCDQEQAGTSPSPGTTCESQRSVTAATRIATHTFTLVFRGGARTALSVYGAADAEEARAFAASVLPHSIYTVVDGDCTNEDVTTFHAWTCAAAQQALGLREAQERNEIRRLIHRIRVQIREEALQAWIGAEHHRQVQDDVSLRRERSFCPASRTQILRHCVMR